MEILAPYDNAVQNLRKLGCVCHDIEIKGRSKNPFADILLYFRLKSKIKLIKPDVILSYTIKPNIYGGIVARRLKIPFIANITGLGTTFNGNYLVKKMVEKMYKWSFLNINKVFFQNKDDRELFFDYKIINEEVAGLLPGSGVNLEEFIPVKKEINQEKIVFLLIARLIREKGIEEYVVAAKHLMEKYDNLEFQILGKYESDCLTGISNEKISKWEKRGLIKYLGVSDDVRNEIKECDCGVLPSFYREGVPRTLIEMAAMGKPLITTDNVGCREIVEHLYNGYLCKKQDTKDLIKKMEMFINLSLIKKKMMGENSRKKVEDEFDEKIVINKYLQEIKNILNN